MAILSAASVLLPLNCATPGTPVRAALCAEPSLRAADNSLTAAYNALLSRTHSASREALSAMQQRFENARQGCMTRRDGRDACLLSETDAQRFRLTGAAFAGTGPGEPMVAEFFGRAASERHMPLEVLLPRFVDPAQPGARAFNQSVSNLARMAPYRRNADPYRAVDTVFGVAGEIAYATTGFISARVTLVEPGEDQPVTLRRVGVNQILDSSRRTDFNALFQKDGAGRLSAACAAQLSAQRRDFFSGAPLVDVSKIEETAITGLLKELDRWIFDADGAEIIFDRGVIGLPAEGPYTCRFAAATLVAVLNPNVEIWP